MNYFTNEKSSSLTVHYANDVIKVCRWWFHEIVLST